MKDLGIRPKNRRVVDPARKAAEEAILMEKGNRGIFCGAAVELQDGSIITGKNSSLMHSASSLVLNAIKHLAGIPEKIPLLSKSSIESVGTLKRNILQSKTVSLDLEETMIILSISAATNPTVQLALTKLQELRGCEVHMTHIPAPGDEAGLKRLGVNLTSEPNFSTKDLFVA
jgi:uncharacterized protein (UPF0371 family)